VKEKLEQKAEEAKAQYARSPSKVQRTLSVQRQESTTSKQVPFALFPPPSSPSQPRAQAKAVKQPSKERLKVFEEEPEEKKERRRLVLIVTHGTIASSCVASLLCHDLTAPMLAGKSKKILVSSADSFDSLVRDIHSRFSISGVAELTVYDEASKLDLSVDSRQGMPSPHRPSHLSVVIAA